MAKRDTKKKIGDTVTFRLARKSGATEDFVEWLNNQPGNLTYTLIKSARLYKKLEAMLDTDSVHSTMIKSLLREIDNEMLLIKYGDKNSLSSTLPSPIPEDKKTNEDIITKDIPVDDLVDQVEHDKKPLQSDQVIQDKIVELVSHKHKSESKQSTNNDKNGEISTVKGSVPMRRF